MDKELIFVSTNAHKAEEIISLGRKHGIKINPVLGEKLEIQAIDTRDVARTAAIMLFNSIRKPMFVDDSGLFIDALDGFPGAIAHFVSKSSVLNMLSGVKNRDAHFKTSICYVDEDVAKIFEGTVSGRIASEPQGDRAFGFDSLFIPIGEEKTFAQMSIEEKSKYSHRARAFEKLAKYVLDGKVL